MLLWLRRRNRVPFSDIAVAFAQLQRRASRIGVPVVESATPFEFRQSLLRRLAELREHRWVQRSTYLQERIDSAETGIDPLVNGYVVAQYSRHAAPMDVLQSASATHLNSTLWLLRWLPNTFCKHAYISLRCLYFSLIYALYTIDVSVYRFIDQRGI